MVRLFILASLAPLASLLAATCSNLQAPPKVFQPCDVVLELTPEEADKNPYLNVRLLAEFKSPRAKTLRIDGFFDGGNRMVLRLVATEPGKWSFRKTSNVKRWDATEDSLEVEDDAAASGFAAPANIYHWQTKFDMQPHLWMGVNVLDFASMPRDQFEAVANARTAQKFTHLRGFLLGTKSFDALPPDLPQTKFFQELDSRILLLNQRGIAVDLIIGAADTPLTQILPNAAQRERFLRYIMGRYAGMNVTWFVLDAFEAYPGGRNLAKSTGAFLKTNDAYQHPRTAGTLGTSSALLPDGWMNFRSYSQGAQENSAESKPNKFDTWALPAIEHQLYPNPSVGIDAAIEAFNSSELRVRIPGSAPAKDARALRRDLWLATMAGQYPYYTAGRDTPLESPGAKAMSVWFDVMSKTRFWDLRPHFDVDGGRAICVPKVEYLVLIERSDSPIEVVVERATYDVFWINIATGERVQPKDKDWKGDKFVALPPDREREWLLHLSREGRKEGMLRSWKFDFAEQPIQMQEIDAITRIIPFEMEQPAVATIKPGQPVDFKVKMLKQTRATREMTFLWLAEVPADGEGHRVAAIGTEGKFQVPKEILRTIPGILGVRLYGMNANGKVYVIDKAVSIEP
jgi:hypothetical protein